MWRARKAIPDDGQSANLDGVNVWSAIDSEREHIIGRNRKFALGDIVYRDHAYVPSFYVVVEYDDTPDARKYRVVPLDSRKRRRGDAIWLESWKIEGTWEHSGTASIKTYRANQALPDRGCNCECCVHEAYDMSHWDNTGGWRAPEVPADFGKEFDGGP